MTKRLMVILLLGALATLGGCEFGVGMDDGSLPGEYEAGLTLGNTDGGTTDGATSTSRSIRKVQSADRAASHPAGLRDNTRETASPSPAMPVLNPLMYPGDRGHGDPQPWAPDSTGHIDL